MCPNALFRSTGEKVSINEFVFVKDHEADKVRQKNSFQKSLQHDIRLVGCIFVKSTAINHYNTQYSHIKLSIVIVETRNLLL